MAITSNVTQQAMQRYFHDVMDELIRQICLQLNYLGQECVKRIRIRKDNWVDQTGNLRSSIAAAVYTKAQGKVTTSVQSIVKPEGKGAESKTKAEEFINSLARQYSNTYALVVVAAMEYAGYVENRPNKDVLNECRLWAEKQVDGYLNDAIENTVAKMNKITL